MNGAISVEGRLLSGPVAVNAREDIEEAGGRGLDFDDCLKGELAILPDAVAFTALGKAELEEAIDGVLLEDQMPLSSFCLPS
jgi:hypothetical protein